MRIRDWSSDVCSSDLGTPLPIETDALRQMANSNRIRDFLEAWQAGDVAAIDGMVADQPCWVTTVVTAELATTGLRSITDRAEVLDPYRTTPAPATSERHRGGKDGGSTCNIRWW